MESRLHRLVLWAEKLIDVVLDACGQYLSATLTRGFLFPPLCTLEQWRRAVVDNKAALLDTRQGNGGCISLTS